MNWIDDLLTAATQKLILMGAAIGVVVSVFQEIIENRYGGWRAYLTRGATAVLVGIGTFTLLADWTASEGVKVGVACAATWCAKDVLDGLRTIGKLFANNPFEALERVRAALRGGSKSDEK